MPHETPSRAWQIVGINRPVCHQLWYISARVGLLFQVSVRLRNPEPSDEYAAIVMMKSLFAEQGTYHNVWSATMEATSAPMHSGGSLTIGASITLHQAHISLSQTASLNGTFKPWNTPWRKLGLDPMSRSAVWKKSGIELTCRNMECQCQEMRNSCSPRPATDHCQRTPWRSWCPDRAELSRPYTSPDHPQVETWSYCREMPTTTLLQGRIAQRKNTTEEPVRHPRDSWAARISQPRRWPAARHPWNCC